MRTIQIMIISLLVCLAASIAGGQSKTLTVRPGSGEFAGKTFYTNSHALIVGISQYKFLPKEKWLDFAAEDAKAMRDILIRSYGFLPENVIILLDEQATKKNIEDALAALADDKRVKSDDRLLVFFSGHGQTVKLGSGGDMGFLIPFDAKVDLKHPDNRGPYLASCLRMDNLWGYLEGSPAKHSLLIADACFGGLLVRGRALNGERPNAAVVSTLSARPALQVLTAGGKNEEAQEDPKLGHGYLTFKLLEELKAQAANADSVFLASQLASSLKTSVGNLTNAKQSPQFGNHNDTEGDFIFVTTEPRSVPSLKILTNPSVPTIDTNGGGGKRPVIRSGKMLSFKLTPAVTMELAQIAAGEFLMGDDDQTNNLRRRVNLDGFYMQTTPVTVAQYQAFCNEKRGGKMPPEPVYNENNFNSGWSRTDHPIVNVSYKDAQEFCDWVSEKTGSKIRLPSEEEWEKAARGTDGKKYPWGNEDPTETNAGKFFWGSIDGKKSHTNPVGQFPPNAYGLYDMVGNVCVWCDSLYNGEQNSRVVRGGSWFNGADIGYYRASFRYRGDISKSFMYRGFRCTSGL